MKLKKTDKEGLFKNIFIAYFILLFHVVLLGGIAVFVVLIKGLFEYLPWIMAGAGLLIALCAWFVIRHLDSYRLSVSDLETHYAA